MPVIKACAFCGKEVSVKPCRVRENNFCSVVHNNYFGRGKDPWNKGRAVISTQNELIRKTVKYKNWRRAIFERDNYTCQICRNYGGQLHADHIKPFAYYPELRFELSNGRTLCVPCHKLTDTFGNKYKKVYEQQTA